MNVRNDGVNPEPETTGNDKNFVEKVWHWNNSTMSRMVIAQRLPCDMQH